MNEYKDIPEHEHSHSLYVHCLSCFTFGISLPSRFVDAVECGNCKSIQTVKYYPSCCILADRNPPESKQVCAYCGMKFPGISVFCSNSCFATYESIHGT